MEQQTLRLLSLLKPTDMSHPTHSKHFQSATCTVLFLS